MMVSCGCSKRWKRFCAVGVMASSWFSFFFWCVWTNCSFGAGGFATIRVCFSPMLGCGLQQVSGGVLNLASVMLRWVLTVSRPFSVVRITATGSTRKESELHLFPSLVRSFRASSLAAWLLRVTRRASERVRWGALVGKLGDVDVWSWVERLSVELCASWDVCELYWRLYRFHFPRARLFTNLFCF